eukprot:scaffold90683_cov84-Phaeocystis_antarctica.AAC.3
MLPGGGALDHEGSLHSIRLCKCAVFGRAIEAVIGDPVRIGAVSVVRGFVSATPAAAVTQVESSPAPIVSAVRLAGFVSATPAAVAQVESSPASISCWAGGLTSWATSHTVLAAGPAGALLGCALGTCDAGGSVAEGQGQAAAGLVETASSTGRRQLLTCERTSPAGGSSRFLVSSSWQPRMRPEISRSALLRSSAPTDGWGDAPCEQASARGSRRGLARAGRAGEVESGEVRLQAAGRA